MLDTAPALIVSGPACQQCSAAVPPSENTRWAGRARTCTACKKSQADERRARWKAAHPGRNEEQIARWHAAHKEHKRDYRHRNKDRDNASRRRRTATDPKCAERKRELGRKYYRRHPDAFKARANKRRAILRNAEGSHTKADLRRIYLLSRGECFWCDKPVGESYHFDHLIPISRDGTNDAGNLVVACSRCNNRKYNHLPLDFAERLRVAA